MEDTLKGDRILMEVINRSELTAYMEFARKHQYILSVYGTSGKTSKIFVDSFNTDTLVGRFYKSEQKMTYKLCNIVSCSFLNQEEQCLFEKEQFLARFTDSKDIEEEINHYKDYYLAVIHTLKNSNNNLNKFSSDDAVDFTQKTLEHYELMFRHIYNHKEGLFVNYLLSQPVNQVVELNNEPVLLLSRSNYSQKQAIESALKDRISIIEGPPGTGKTTTILSIIANLVVRGKRVAVISKNNSAIDNIKDELDRLKLPPFYIRLGNKEVMNQLKNVIKVLVQETANQVEQMKKLNSNGTRLFELYKHLKKMEADINRIMKIKNQLQEDENQLRHLLKLKEAFNETRDFNNIRWFSKSSLLALRSEIDRIAHKLQRLDSIETISLWNRLLNRLLWRMDVEQFQTDGLLLQFQLEHIYLEKKINKFNTELKNSGLEEKQDELKKLYDSEYINASLQVLQNFLHGYCSQDGYRNAVKSICSYDMDNILSACRNELREIYPVILTTADALVYNFKDLLQSGSKIDYIIMDEASQCDLIAGLPMLSLAERCVIVGDQKQLSAITNEPSDELSMIDKPHNFYHQTFLSSLQQVWDIKPTLLKEHYRCDYAIINYCNKFFYDGELIIYTEANSDSMQLLTVDQGKYVDKMDSSFYNDREIKSIEGIAGSCLESSYVITPFAGQGKRLRAYFKCDKETCGTIHTFQGRGQDTVYFSTVLNDLQFCNNHLSGNHCLFTKELLNVAVSRAKKRFVLVSDCDYLRKKNNKMKDLINYIETYGKKIPDKTVCIFDGLYRLMKSYTRIDNLDNVFEKEVYDRLRQYCHKYQKIHCLVKLPLANLVTDKVYLDANSEIKRFVLHKNTHIDFTLYNAINNPILAIELDGKSHEREDQMERDAKKDVALRHMGIPVWRLSSKSALTQEDFEKQLGLHAL